jgi:NAD(P)-dependent dehydrogenase (short-subunit alcohol dehydrogenase family)
MSSATIRELFSLSDKVALITAAARNLGYDISLGLADAGAEVAITSRTLEDAARSAASIAGYTGRRTVGFRCGTREERDVSVAGFEDEMALLPIPAE